MNKNNKLLNFNNKGSIVSSIKEDYYMLLPKRKFDWKSFRDNLLKYEQELRKETPVVLDDKVDEFIKWYSENIAKENDFEINPTAMRNFIEKMAVWYELRYPDYEINRLIFGFDQEDIEIDDVMFNNNGYMHNLFSEYSNVIELHWNEFYNIKAFINSLPCKERWLFDKPKYYDTVYVRPDLKGAHLHLTSKGFVEDSEGLSAYTDMKISDKDLLGLHIKSVVQLLNENGIVLPFNNDLEATINNFEKKTYQKEEMLNCVMYRIIERGGNRVGPRRAFLFAKEFGRNIDISMMYGVNYSDPGLREFINEYIKAGGSTDLVCYVDYFVRKNKKEKTYTVSIQELIKYLHDDYFREEQVKQLMLQLKLNKSQNNKN